jgi:hypothetical protein
MNPLIIAIVLAAGQQQPPAAPPSDFKIELWAMTAARHQWPSVPEPAPAKQAVPVATAPPKDHRTPEQKASDDRLLADYSALVARCGTGRVILDKASGFYVPELKCDGKDGKQAHR